MFYLVMIPCNVSEKSYEEQIIPSEGWDLDTNIQNNFPVCFLSYVLGIEQEKGLLLLLGCSLYEGCFDKRIGTPLKFFNFSPNVLLLYTSLGVQRKCGEGLEPLFLVRDALITASQRVPAGARGCSRFPFPAGSLCPRAQLQLRHKMLICTTNSPLQQPCFDFVCCFLFLFSSIQKIVKHN